MFESGDNVEVCWQHGENSIYFQGKILNANHGDQLETSTYDVLYDDNGISLYDILNALIF